MPSLQRTTIAIALIALSAASSAAIAEQDDSWKLHPVPERVSGDPGGICAAEGERLYGIPAKEFKTVSVQIAAEGKKLVRLSIGKEWYACTLDRLHGLVDFRGG